MSTLWDPQWDPLGRSSWIPRGSCPADREGEPSDIVAVLRMGAMLGYGYSWARAAAWLGKGLAGQGIGWAGQEIGWATAWLGCGVAGQGLRFSALDCTGSVL